MNVESIIHFKQQEDETKTRQSLKMSSRTPAKQARNVRFLQAMCAKLRKKKINRSRSEGEKTIFSAGQQSPILRLLQITIYFGRQLTPPSLLTLAVCFESNALKVVIDFILVVGALP